MLDFIKLDTKKQTSNTIITLAYHSRCSSWKVSSKASIDHIVNVLYKRCGLAKTRLRHPSLPFDSFPTPPVQSLDAYARSITWQPNKKRLTVFHEYGALSHARFARAAAPLKKIPDNRIPKTPGRAWKMPWKRIFWYRAGAGFCYFYWVGMRAS